MTRRPVDQTDPVDLVRPIDVVLATCRTWPSLSRSDRELADELVARGCSVAAHPWNDAPFAAFETARMVVLRSNWDYHHDLDAFDRWLGDLDAAGVDVRNPVGLVREHLAKSYLPDLAAAGIRVPNTLAGVNLDADRVVGWADAHGFDRVVVKPAWGASGHDVELVHRSELVAAGTRWRRLASSRPVIVQEYIPAVRAGEFALVFFAGEFSHALLRQPADDDFRVNGQFGGTMTLERDVDPGLVAFGSSVIATLDPVPTYARIDVVGTGIDPVLMEIEVNEPALGLHLAPGSAGRFADALVGSTRST